MNKAKWMWLALGAVVGGVGRPLCVHAAYLSIIAMLAFRLWA